MSCSPAPQGGLWVIGLDAPALLWVAAKAAVKTRFPFLETPFSCQAWGPRVIPTAPGAAEFWALWPRMRVRILYHRPANDLP